MLNIIARKPSKYAGSLDHAIVKRGDSNPFHPFVVVRLNDYLVSKECWEHGVYCKTLNEAMEEFNSERRV